MRKALVVGCFVVFSLLSAAAQQDKPKAEVFGGYEYANGDGTSFNGWNTAVTGNITRSFGITADFAGVYKNGHIYSYMFGPVLSARGKHVRPFVHSLFGGATGGGSTGGSTAFSMALGGGVDVSAGNHFAFRLFQLDWWVLRSNGVIDKNNGRVSSGIVIRF